MEFKIIFWIVVGIIWVISQVFKKNKEIHKQVAETTLPAVPVKEGGTLQKTNTEQKPRPASSARPSTHKQGFQPQLKKSVRTIVKLPKETKETFEKPIKRYDLQNYDSDLIDEESGVLAKLKSDKEEARKMKVRNAEFDSANFEPYAVQQSAPAKIFQMLKNPEDVRNAIVIAEILKTKF